jgi:hypothetical protein
MTWAGGIVAMAALALVTAVAVLVAIAVAIEVLPPVDDEPCPGESRTPWNRALLRRATGGAQYDCRILGAANTNREGESL